MAYMVSAIGAGLVLPRLEHHFWPDLVSSMSAQAAIAISSAVSSGMIALTAIVFSLAFVMVQFSATAYSPRLVLWIARDPVLSHSMGVFSATFLYALLMIAWVDREGSGRVPLVSEYMIFGLLLASMGAFVALVDRIGRLQVNRMLIFTGDQGRDSIAELYPPADSPAPPAAATAPPAGALTNTVAHVGRPQVIQAIRVESVDRAPRWRPTASSRSSPPSATRSSNGRRSCGSRACGRSTPASSKAPSSPATSARSSRTPSTRSGSSSISPSAHSHQRSTIRRPRVQALDQIEDLLIRLGNRRLEIGTFADATGRVRLVVPFPEWDDFLRLAFEEIRVYGATSVQIMRRMRALMASLADVVPPDRLPPLRRWERRLEESIEHSFSTAEQRREASVVDRQGLGIGRDRNAG